MQNLDREAPKVSKLLLVMSSLISHSIQSRRKDNPWHLEEVEYFSHIWLKNFIFSCGIILFQDINHLCHRGFNYVASFPFAVLFTNLFLSNIYCHFSKLAPCLPLLNQFRNSSNVTFFQQQLGHVRIFWWFCLCMPCQNANLLLVL